MAKTFNPYFVHHIYFKQNVTFTLISFYFCIPQQDNNMQICIKSTKGTQWLITWLNQVVGEASS